METQKPSLTRTQGELLLAVVIIARSTSFLCSKILMQGIDPFNLMAVRFLLAFFLLTALFHKRLFPLSAATALRGFLLGLSFFAVMTAELFGLRLTDSSTTSFLENTAIVFVPILETILLRRLPRPVIIASTLVTMVGIGLLTLDNGPISWQGGEPLCILAAVLYAVAIILTARLSREGDPLVLGVLQVGTMGALALIASLLFETPRLPASGLEWGAVLWLTIVCSGFGFTFQPVAQSYTTAQRAGMFCSLSPVSSAILGVCILGEDIGPRAVLGAVLVMAGILIVTLFGKNTQNPNDLSRRDPAGFL